MRSKRLRLRRKRPASRRLGVRPDASRGVKRKAESFLMWLLGWALAVGGGLHAFIFLYDIRPQNGLLDLPCYVVYVGLHLLVVSAGLKVLGHRRGFRTAAGGPSGLARFVREAGVHYVGFVGCIIAAWFLLLFFCRWPFRLIYVDLALSEVHFLDGSSGLWGHRTYARNLARLDTAFVINVGLLFAAFELAILMRKFSVFRRSPATGTAAAGAMALVLFVLFFPAYAKARGFWKLRGLFKRSGEVAIKYRESLGFLTGDFVIASDGAADLSENGGASYVSSSEQQMLELLEILADGGFFEMEGVLYPYGWSDGLWKTLEVTDGEVTHRVRSYHNSVQDRRFDALVKRLTGTVGL